MGYSKKGALSISCKGYAAVSAFAGTAAYVYN